MRRWKSYSYQEVLETEAFRAQVYKDSTTNTYTLVLSVKGDGLSGPEFLAMEEYLYSEIEAKELGEKLLKELSRLYKDAPEYVVVGGVTSGLLRPTIEEVVDRLLGRIS